MQEETETALVAYTEELQASSDLSRAVQKYEALVNLTRARYAKGLITVTDVLDIERDGFPHRKTF